MNNISNGIKSLFTTDRSITDETVTLIYEYVKLGQMRSDLLERWTYPNKDEKRKHLAEIRNQASARDGKREAIIERVFTTNNSSQSETICRTQEIIECIFDDLIDFEDERGFTVPFNDEALKAWEETFYMEFPHKELTVNRGGDRS